MELMHQQYDDIMDMPVQRFYNMLKWKTNLEEEKRKLLGDK